MKVPRPVDHTRPYFQSQRLDRYRGGRAAS